MTQQSEHDAAGAGDAAADALAGIATAFAADNYRMDVVTTAGNVRLTVRPGPGACGECLIPASQLRAMAASALAGGPLAGRDIVVDYPPEAQQ
ncbi:hypothetical protein ACFFX1_15320 [Dactylosporangium sucinum]|uniref:Uncharacterized protein n=1 Tax=Dactylosporangium sucinum TaxID=1424081 RepID=A0A917TV30_9ACTN|nr:hypothetical protein [Dactylosporangium sucinum]GGM38915.1 hypothetical protein GCM10007977_045460 [Dactylosporangium sucinum]